VRTISGYLLNLAVPPQVRKKIAKKIVRANSGVLGSGPRVLFSGAAPRAATQLTQKSRQDEEAPPRLARASLFGPRTNLHVLQNPGFNLNSHSHDSADPSSQNYDDPFHAPDFISCLKIAQFFASARTVTRHGKHQENAGLTRSWSVS
jgi:hypothetical protein